MNKNNSKINVLMEKTKACCVKFKCNIVTDKWTGIRHCPLTNIMVTCADSPYFLRTIDCTGHHKAVNFQFEVLREATKEVGQQNMILIVTDAANVCKAMWKLMEAAYKYIWTPCSVHAMNNAPKQMGKMD